MSFQLNKNIAAEHACNALLPNNAEAVKTRLELSSRNKMQTSSGYAPAFSTGIAIQQKVIQMQSTQYNIRSAKDILSTAEMQLNSIKELFNKAKTVLADARNDFGNAPYVKAASDTVNCLSQDIGKFESAISFSLSGIGNYRNMLDTNDEFLTSAISNSTASVSRMLDAAAT